MNLFWGIIAFKSRSRSLGDKRKHCAELMSPHIPLWSLASVARPKETWKKDEATHNAIGDDKRHPMTRPLSVLSPHCRVRQVHLTTKGPQGPGRRHDVIPCAPCPLHRPTQFPTVCHPRFSLETPVVAKHRRIWKTETTLGPSCWRHSEAGWAGSMLHSK